jgi:hypothetical protein
MIDEDWFDRGKSDLKGVRSVEHVGAFRARPIEVRQIAGVLLLLSLLLPALVSGTRRDWVEGLGLTLLSSPLLAWLSIPLRPSDDLFDETYRRQAEAMDVLALILLWTWPWTCAVPFVAIGRCVRILLPGVL